MENLVNLGAGALLIGVTLMLACLATFHQPSPQLKKRPPRGKGADGSTLGESPH